MTINKITIITPLIPVSGPRRNDSRSGDLIGLSGFIAGGVGPSIGLCPRRS